jgi:hypothetical protein
MLESDAAASGGIWAARHRDAGSRSSPSLSGGHKNLGTVMHVLATPKRSSKFESSESPWMSYGCAGLTESPAGRISGAPGRDVLKR